MGRLLGLGQELWVGEGEGEAGQGGGGRLAGSTPPAAGPSGALTAQCGPLLRREGRGNWGSWQRRARVPGLCFSSLCHPQAP